MALLVGALLAGCGGGGSGEEGSTSARKPFAPRASLRAIGGTKRTEKPELVMLVKARPGDANIRSATIELPPVLLVDQAALGNICSERGLAEEDCAGRKRMGVARVVSPAYDEPLKGPVFAVTGSGGLPRLAYLLSGPADVLLRGRIDSQGARIRAGVENAPDTPMRSFEFRIDGGEPGYLELSHDICKGEPMADASFTSQSGESHHQRIPLEADCGG